MTQLLIYKCKYLLNRKCELDISCIDFEALKKSGIRVVVFDKDNTLSLPYASNIHPQVENGFEVCKRVFGIQNVAILSNSAGGPDDIRFGEAVIIEREFGVSVIRHGWWKKPLCGNAIQKHFNDLKFQEIRMEQIAVIGDRLATDVYMANWHGMLAVYVRPISDVGDNAGAICVRGWETSWLNRRAKYHSSGIPCSRPDLQQTVVIDPFN